MSQPQRNLSVPGKLYVGAISLAGATAILIALSSIRANPSENQWLFLAALTVLAGFFTVRIPTVPATVSISESFVFLTVLLFGTAPAVLTVALEGLLISAWRYRHSVPRILFNTFEAPASLLISSTLFFYLAGTDLNAWRSHLGQLLIPLLALALGYFLLNSLLMAVAVAFETGSSPLSIWRKHFLWLSIDYFGGASIAVLLFLASATLSVTTLVAIVTPILVICYLTFRLATEKVEEATKHLRELNTLYISTIETLASAIDAKDQITHGHIRRVQKHAIALSERLGFRDEESVRAIEAAALLHDMGKLAIPEYILNKPGKLTDAEFEKMKAHASLGADILSRVNFPYPVIPIVRHHHEHWDGSGYPDSLKAQAIPIGARILAVVDCFDALTSDRPYRPKLAKSAALEILRQRAGSMYDPVVVDAFFEMESQAEPNDVGIEGRMITSGDVPEPAFDTIASSTSETVALYQLSTDLADCRSLSIASPFVAKELSRLLQADLILIFHPEESHDEIAVTGSYGERAAEFTEYRLAFGRGLSGWVAANKRSIVNSDPILDFGDGARSRMPVLRSCLSVPILAGGSLIGVASAYSSRVSAFSEEHRRIAETLCEHAARFIGQARSSSMTNDDGRIDSLTGVLAPGVLEEEIDSLLAQLSLPSQALDICVIDIVGLSSINIKHGKKAGDLILRLTAEALSASVPRNSIVGRLESDEFVCVSGSLEPDFAERLQNKLFDASQDIGIRFSANVKCRSVSVQIGADILESLNQIRAPFVSTGSAITHARSSVH